MGEVTGVPWSTFISVEVIMFGFIISVGIIAITNKATAASESRHNNDKFVKLEVDIEKKTAEHKLELDKINAEHKLDLEKLRTEHKFDLEKLHDKKEENTIFFADSLAKFNTVLTDFKLTMGEFKSTMQHIEKTVGDLNAKMEKQEQKFERFTATKQRA